jgi:diaminohydroxyphosphoribosylaminopyrimidine deaminase/5-amino-6-(5-phosphoribosylamino)uracil reductase
MVSDPVQSAAESNGAELMRLALSVARANGARTSPNPSVGAVLSKYGTVVATGATESYGGRHAESVALDALEREQGTTASRGCLLAVTLEPCAHHGRQPPCVTRIIGAGVARVLVGVGDPNPAVNGLGIRQLRASGIEVVDGVLGDACRSHHRGYLSVIERRRPFVTLKLAASLDGRIATPSGESKWISSIESRETVQRMRAESDAVLVGAGTVLADAPRLSVRLGSEPHQPWRIVLDSHLRTATWALGSPERTWLICSSECPPTLIESLQRAGVRVSPVARRDGALVLDQALTLLASGGVGTLLVEGGSRVAASLLRARLVDELHWFVAPQLLGGDGLPALGSLDIRLLCEAIALELREVTRCGTDLHLTLRMSSASQPN